MQVRHPPITRFVLPDEEVAEEVLVVVIVAREDPVVEELPGFPSNLFAGSRLNRGLADQIGSHPRTFPVFISPEDKPGVDERRVSRGPVR
ncbi:MAG: hypothetical protein CMJ70_12610 [Planctomycetaceae bacterium]|nr:hypothetical protein [Planctomycetaceae bacterium]